MLMKRQIWALQEPRLLANSEGVVVVLVKLFWICMYRHRKHVQAHSSLQTTSIIFLEVLLFVISMLFLC